MISIIDLPTASALTVADYGKALRSYHGLAAGLACELATGNPGERILGVLANLYTVGVQQFAKITMSGIQQILAGGAFADGTPLAVDTNGAFVTRVQGDFFAAYARAASTGAGIKVYAEIIGDDMPFDRTSMIIREMQTVLTNVDVGKGLQQNATTNWELATGAGPVQDPNILERLYLIGGVQYGIATALGLKTGIARLLCDQIIAIGDELALFTGAVHHRVAAGTSYAFIAMEASTAANQLILARGARGRRP